jgi:hypothetical protein
MFLMHPSDQLISNYDSKLFTTSSYGILLDVLITPEVARADEGVRNLSPADRQCFFENEGNLK